MGGDKKGGICPFKHAFALLKTNANYYNRTGKGREERREKTAKDTPDGPTEVRVIVKDPWIVVRREVVDVLQGIPRARSTAETNTKKHAQRRRRAREVEVQTETKPLSCALTKKLRRTD